MYVVMSITLCIGQYSACMWRGLLQNIYGYILHVFGNDSYSLYRATYCMYVVMLVTVSIGLYTAHMWLC